MNQSKSATSVVTISSAAAPVEAEKKQKTAVKSGVRRRTREDKGRQGIFSVSRKLKRRRGGGKSPPSPSSCATFGPPFFFIDSVLSKIFFGVSQRQ